MVKSPDRREKKEIEAQHRDNGGHRGFDQSSGRGDHQDGDKIEKSHSRGVHVDQSKKHKRDRGDHAQRKQKAQQQVSRVARGVGGHRLICRSR